MSMKRTLAIVAAAAMMMAQPLTTLAATPGDNLTPQFEIHDAGTTGTVDFSNQTSGTTTAPAATQAGKHRRSCWYHRTGHGSAGCCTDHNRCGCCNHRYDRQHRK